MKYYKKFTLNCQQRWKVMPWGSRGTPHGWAKILWDNHGVCSYI